MGKYFGDVNWILSRHLASGPAAEPGWLRPASGAILDTNGPGFRSGIFSAKQVVACHNLPEVLPLCQDDSLAIGIVVYRSICRVLPLCIEL